MTSGRKENVSGVRPPQWKRRMRVLWCRVSLCGSVGKKTPTHLTFLFTFHFLSRCWSAHLSVPSWMITDEVVVQVCLMKASGSMAMTSCCHTCLPLAMIKGRVWGRTWMSLNYVERDSPIILCILVKNRHLYSFHTGHGMPQHCQQYIPHRVCGLSPQ